MAASLPEEAVAMLKATFEKYDTDHDGFICAKDIVAGESVEGMELTEAEVLGRLGLTDAEAKFDFDQYLATVAASSDGPMGGPMGGPFDGAGFMPGADVSEDVLAGVAMFEAIFENMLKEFDVDEDGFVTKDEIKTVMTRMNGGTALTDAEVDSFCNLPGMDTDGDGKISFKEFVKGMIAQGKFH